MLSNIFPEPCPIPVDTRMSVYKMNEQIKFKAQLREILQYNSVAIKTTSVQIKSNKDY